MLSATKLENRSIQVYRNPLDALISRYKVEEKRIKERNPLQASDKIVRTR